MNFRNKCIKNLVFALATAWIAPATLPAGPGNYNQQGPALVGSGAIGGSFQGSTVALSGDGNTAIVGGERDNNNFGAAWIFTRTNGIWSQQGEKLVPSDASGSPFFGAAAALSADGNTAVVGGISDSPVGFSSIGAVWVFTRSGNAWTQQGPKLVGTGVTGDCGGARQGAGVGLSADGNTLVEFGRFDGGNHRCDGATGAAWVFTRSAGTWAQEGNKLVGFFSGVAISGNGNTLAGDFVDGYQVFTHTSGGWAPQGSLLTDSDKDAYDQSIFLTTDGNALLARGRFFYRKNGVWSTGPRISNSSGHFALSSDGSTAVGVGVDQAGNVGVFLFAMIHGIWVGNNFYVPSGWVGKDEDIDFPMALSGNGNTMIAGGTGDPPPGDAWVFAAPQLQTSLAHTGDFHVGQNGATYTITVKNAGDRGILAGAASTVNLIDHVPAGLTLTGLFGNGWNCTLSTATCMRSDGLAVGAEFPPVTVTVNVASNASASVTNAATASGGGSNWGNATDMTTILP